MRTLALAAVVSIASMGAAHAGNWDGSWRGTYRCGQGVTGLTLVLDETADGIVGEFRFDAIAENPDVPSGAFRMRGAARGNQIDLQPDVWIRQPPGYGMVALQGQLVMSGAGISGSVAFPGCSTFSVARVIDAAHFVAQPVKPKPAPKPAPAAKPIEKQAPPPKAPTSNGPQ